MFSFLARLSTPTGSPSSTRTNSPRSAGFSPNALNAAFASDPSQWERTFDKCWEAVERLLERKENNPEHIVPYEELSHLLSQLNQMNELLMMEVNSQPEPVIGPILERYFNQEIMERIMDWAIQIPDGTRPICQLALIRIYEAIVGESHTQNHCLLVHKPILNPLLRLFNWCKRLDGPRPTATGEPSINDKHFVLLLNQICTKLAEDKTLLHFFFKYEAGYEQFSVFTLLVPFLYEQNDIGQLARDAVLLILAVSKNHDGIAEFIGLKSYFCPVLATGLSGCFSQLPRVLAPEGSDRLVPEHYSEALSNFVSSIIFCDAVVQTAHSVVATQICNFFYSGFLVSVVKTALLQDEREAVAACTMYLQLCLSVLKEPSLIKTVVRLLLVERDEKGIPLIEVVIEGIKGHDRLASASVQLLETAVNLVCEDVMVMLALRNLLPLRFTTQQLGKVYDTFYTQSLAQKLLGCIPLCMLKVQQICSSETVAQYVEEGGDMVNSFASKCSFWKWRYDGVKPTLSLFRTDSDDELNSTTFSRLSSFRSSLTSGRGLNRYAVSRASHLTAESTLGALVDLGAPTPDGPADTFDEPVVEEDEDFQLPAVSMSTSMVDYFQLAAFDDLSEGDETSCQDIQSAKTSLRRQITDSGTDSDTAMAKSFVLSGWADVEDFETFLSLLDKQPLPKGAENTSVEESISYINARIQYWDELKAETAKEEVVERKESSSSSILNQNMTFGLPIDPTTDPSIFLEAVLSQLEVMFDHSFTWNLHFTSLLTSLLAYPLPLLIVYLFEGRRGEGKSSLLEVLLNLKKRVDELTANIDGIDVWIGRALRTLQARVERAERAGDGQRGVQESPKDDISPISMFFRNTKLGSSERRPRYHIHKAVESPETARDDEQKKNLVYAAIVIANLVQSLAGVILQHPLAVVRQQ